jgi:hypothetical protein
MRSMSNRVIAGLSTLAISALGLWWSATPASAFSGGFHGGMGGFRPGGFHAGFASMHPGFGGFHPALHQGFVGFRPGFVGHRFFHRGFQRNTVVIAGVAAGGYWGGYGDGCWTYQPVYDAYGRYLGQQYVNICY